MRLPTCKKLGDGRIIFWCPACEENHGVYVDHSNPKANWSWNGSLESPTFKPSIRVTSYNGDKVKGVCHSYVTEGTIKFLSDSTHSLSGQSVPLPPIGD